MTAPADTLVRPPAPATGGCSDPYGQGLPADVTTRLLAGRFHREDLDRYYLTPHFRRLREEVIEVYGGCCLCGCRFRLRLTAHHRHYRCLFREDVFKDVSCICRGCHGKFHRSQERRISWRAKSR